MRCLAFAMHFGPDLFQSTLFLPVAARALRMSVSAEEVAKHNKDSDCWVIVGDQVLDVTAFLSHLDFDRCNSFF